MACSNPKPAILVKSNTSKTGKKIKFLNANHEGVCDYVSLRKKYGDIFVEIPCGTCDSCIETRTKSWAIRCTLEAALYDHNCFLTLTYNPKCLPKNGLCKSDVYKFIKRLRNTFGAGIRYYGCGEYGSLFDRPHYHMILFNFWPEDAQPCKYDAITGCTYFTSKKLQHLWPFGFVSIGECTYNSCAYVARYCQKKIAHNDLGLAGYTKEFSFMSRRPGIGEKYFKEHYDSLINTDRIYLKLDNSCTFSSFRYFDKLIEKVDPEKLQELKSQRIVKGEISVASELLTRNLTNMQNYLLFVEETVGEKYNRLKRRI